MSGHPDAADLAAYLDGDKTVDAFTIAEHLVACVECRQLIADLTEVRHVLGSADVWEHIEDIEAAADERRSTVEDLLSMQARAASEAVAARVVLNALRLRPVALWATLLGSTPEHRSDGLVRLLLDVEVESVMNSDPRRALDVLIVAERIAEAVADRTVRLSTLGDIWKQRSNALRHLGQYDDSLRAADEAKAFYDTLIAGAFDAAQASYTRAATLFKMTHYGAAMALCRETEEVLRDFGDTVPLIKVLMLKAVIVQEQGDLRSALSAWHQVVPVLERMDQPVELARVRANLAECKLQTGSYVEALRDAKDAIQQYERLGMAAERIRAEWTVAIIKAALGHSDEAIAMLDQCATAFDRLGMAADSGFVRLDLTEQLIKRRRWSEAAGIARELVDWFTRANVTVASVNALAFLRAAVESESASSEIVQYIRDYVGADDPDLPFAPPVI